MEDDLTWLARNVTDSHMCDWYIKVADGYSSMTGGTPTGMSGTWCSREQIIQRRAELQNKPSWDDAPGWANWLCQRDDGMWFWCVEEPRASEDGWETRHEARAAYPSGDQIPECVLGDWRDTLERRPRDLSEPAVTASLTEATENVLAAVPALMGEKFSIYRTDWFERGELPPVGCVCQFFSAGYDGDWFDWCIFHGKASCGGFIVEHHHRTSPERVTVVMLDPDLTKFRPISTDRDKAIDEMKQHCPHHGSWDTVGRIYAEALYDAGYRKQNLPAN